MHRDDIVGACLSRFHDDENSFELLLAYADGREIGHSLSRTAAEEIAAVFVGEFSAALSEQTLPVRVKTLEWDEFSTTARRHFQSNTILGQFQVSYLGEFECWQLYSPQKSNSWKENFSRHPSPEAAKAAAQSDYETRIRSALVNAQADADVVERWQPIETAPKDGTQILCALHLWNDPANGYCFEVASWIGDCWSSEAYPIYPPTHWCPLPNPPALRSSGSAEVGSASTSTGTGGGE